MQIPELDAVTVEVIVDNFIDVFEPSRPGIVERVTPGRLKQPMLAAHGLSYLVTLQRGEETARILMDASNSPTVFFHNLDALERSVDHIDALFLSHGHPDHYGGIWELLARRQTKLPIYLHPESYYPKLLLTPKGRVGPWTLERDKIIAAKVELHENEGPALINDLALITGPIEASVPYETPLPGPKRIVDGQEERDSFTDEQALVMKVAGKGLVVVSACSHPGIVNIIKYAQKLTGTIPVAAVIGGFHLTAGGAELIKNTVKGLQEINPGLVVAGHCTGFRALTQLAAGLPDSFMVSCVGTQVIINSEK
jgi:7,8-dihydropterin-6-yl-methyl-4-(beta-D-ribofuranosyl)aminobenzene 5'-phosphate synthase